MTAVLDGTSPTVRDEHVIVPPVDTSVGQVGRLCFDNGICGFHIHTDPGLSQLLEARFTPPTPSVWSSADLGVHIEYPLGSRLLRRGRANLIRLHPDLPWAINMHGSVELVTADLTGTDLRSFAAHGEAAHIRLTLGHLTGTRVIRFDTVTDVRIERPTRIPVRVEIAAAARHVQLDDWQLDDAPRGTTEQTPGYATADGRYLIVISGGAFRLTVGVTGQTRQTAPAKAGTSSG